MYKGKEVYRSVLLSDNIKPSALSVIDQIRLILSKLSNDDTAELNTNEKLTIDSLKKLSALSTFIDKATSRLDTLKKDSVTILLSSEFLPYLDEVIHSKTGKGRYYDFEVRKREVPIPVKHTFVVIIRRKQAGGGSHET